jgi:hypothetical protein
MKNNINKGFKFTLGKTIFIVTKVNENKVYFTDLKHHYSCHDYEFEDIAKGEKILYA